MIELYDKNMMNLIQENIDKISAEKEKEISQI